MVEGKTFLLLALGFYVTCSIADSYVIDDP